MTALLHDFILAVNYGFVFLAFALGWALTALLVHFLWYLVLEIGWRRIKRTYDFGVLMTVIRENKNRFTRDD